MTKLAYTINEAAYEIGIGRTKLYREISAGRIAVRKVGKRTLILLADLEVYLQSLPTGYPRVL